MKGRYIFRMLLWGMLFIISLVLGVLGLLENKKRNPVIINDNPNPTPLVEPSTNQETTNNFIGVNILNEFSTLIKTSTFTYSKDDLKIVVTNDVKPIISLSESNALTDATYNTILSLLEIIFEEEKYINYFKENYNSITIGNKTFYGFVIETNPPKTESENSYFKIDDPYIRITINKEQINL